jgi:hypothetical protein
LARIKNDRIKKEIDIIQSGPYIITGRDTARLNRPNGINKSIRRSYVNEDLIAYIPNFNRPTDDMWVLFTSYSQMKYFFPIFFLVYIESTLFEFLFLSKWINYMKGTNKYQYPNQISAQTMIPNIIHYESTSSYFRRYIK